MSYLSKTCRAAALTALAFAGLSMAAAPSQAQLQIDVNSANVEPLPVAVTDIHGETPTTQDLGREIASVIRGNLTRSGLFRVVDPKAHLQDPGDIQVRPNFADWRVIQAQALVAGNVAIVSDGRLRTEFRLWDVFGGQLLTGLVYFTTPENARRIGHIISDAIYKRLTGEDGYFDTRIVYVAESGPPDRRVKRLAIMDQDSANHRYLTDGQNLVLTPRFSPTQQVVTYMSYFQNQPRVYLYNIDTGQQEILGEFPGMTYAPRFSPDGESVAFSMSRDGNSDIFVMDLRTRITRRLTQNLAIDTSPSLSPDGQRVTFNSDRSGTQQLYTMNIDGTDVQRITFGEGRYATPVWSPRGDLIAFTRFHRGRFFIGVIRPDGTGERLLTESYLDEGPTWSPNGRVIMFFRQVPGSNDGRGGSVKLWSVDLTGQNLRRVNTPLDGSDPAWSPLSHHSE
ncbi:MAG: Tol-Pal system beta propeller repeat protein TolB [Minwuia sp.]|uniref:Tol-Pal system beta propeller repeat protein TolB n=1 Tax=Minwuia sp. TaxID=2493630 RepID=UPI003A8785C9